MENMSNLEYLLDRSCEFDLRKAQLLDQLTFLIVNNRPEVLISSFRAHKHIKSGKLSRKITTFGITQKQSSDSQNSIRLKYSCSSFSKKPSEYFHHNAAKMVRPFPNSKRSHQGLHSLFGSRFGRSGEFAKIIASHPHEGQFNPSSNRKIRMEFRLENVY